MPEKGIHYLIEAYQGISTDKKLVIAGGSSHSNDYVEQLAAMSFDNDNILFTGFVQGQVLEELYSNAFLYVLPSDVEGLPISLLEAMSYQRCCLISDIKENTTTCGNHAFAFQQGNIQDLREKLEEILRMSLNKIEEMGAKAQNHVFQTYQWMTVAKSTLEVYGKTLLGHTMEYLKAVSCGYQYQFEKEYHIPLEMDIDPILGVNILVTDMEKTVNFVEKNIKQLSGEYVCVSNGHTTVMAYENEDYKQVQNTAVLDFPDGEPLSIVSRRRGFKNAKRVAGPDFMEHMFLQGNNGDGLRHFFMVGNRKL